MERIVVDVSSGEVKTEEFTEQEIYDLTHPGPKPGVGYVLQDEPEEGLCWCRGVTATHDAIDALCSEKRAAGFTYDGNTYQLREQDLLCAIGWGAKLVAGTVAPSGGRMRTIDNRNVSISDADLAILCTKLQEYVQALIHKRQDHHDAITAIVASAEALYPSDRGAASCKANKDAENYDITAGWPVATYTTPEE